MSENIPVETRLMIHRIVRQICMKIWGFVGPMGVLAQEFAYRYFEALRSGDEALQKDVVDVYKSFGLDEKVIKEIKKLLDERYGKKS